MAENRVKKKERGFRVGDLASCGVTGKARLPAKLPEKPGTGWGVAWAWVLPLGPLADSAVPPLPICACPFVGRMLPRFVKISGFVEDCQDLSGFVTETRKQNKAGLKIWFTHLCPGNSFSGCPSSVHMRMAPSVEPLNKRPLKLAMHQTVPRWPSIDCGKRPQKIHKSKE